jgi:hypothetical protein
MRWLAWCGLACAVTACGQSRSRPAAQRAGDGSGAASGTNGSAAASGSEGSVTSGSGGATASDAGKSAGGARATAGSGAGLAGVGGAGASSGSAGAESGTAGTPAAAGGVATGGSGGDGAAGDGDGGAAPDFVCRGLTACGCGCCADSSPKVTCYYPEYGDDLVAIKDADDLASMSPDCENAGCSAGIHYVCCATPSEARAGEYTAYVTPEGGIAIMHMDPNHVFCRFLSLAPGGPDAYPNVELPEGYSLEQPIEAACNDTAYQQGSVGALGHVTITPSCTLNLDVSVAFGYRPDAIEVERLVTSDLPVDGLVCP